MAEYTSPYDVPALADRYPVLGDIEGMQAAFERIHRGDPIGAATIVRAEQVVNSLKLRQFEGDDRINQDLIRAAEARVEQLKRCDADARFPVENNLNTILDAITEFRTEMRNLTGQVNRSITRMNTRITRMDVRIARMDVRIARMDTRVARMDTRIARMDTRLACMDTRITRLDDRIATLDARMTAESKNVGIRSMNRAQVNLPHAPLRPLFKTVAGPGTNLLVNLGGLHQGQHEDVDLNAAVGTQFGNGDTITPATLTQAETDRLVIFYNESFGINPGDSLTTKREKVLRWLL